MATQLPPQHTWYTPADCAAMLDGTRHGDHYRAPCPVHPGNPTSLSIREGTDKYGHPKTTLHCFAHECTREAICAAMGIQVRQLYAIHPADAQATRNVPRAHSPRIDRLKTMEAPTTDDVIQVLLEELIVTDPEWIETCQPAREKMWELAQADPCAREALTKALHAARLNPARFWDTLHTEQQKAQHYD